MHDQFAGICIVCIVKHNEDGKLTSVKSSQSLFVIKIKKINERIN